MAETEPRYCARHPRVESRLACSKCETLICPRCLVQTPVGARCPDCAQLRRVPTFELDTMTFVKAVGTGAVLAGVTGFLWGLLFFDLFRLPFLPWIATIGIGYLVGEGISVSVNRKRGRYLQYIAGASMVLSYAVAGLVSPLVFVFTFPDIFFLVILVIGVFVAAGRVG
ncbi:MAG: B-box zinc finger protein [Chloroflexota bacterium]